MEQQGTVKFFNDQKGFGFIAPSDGSGKDVFVHVTALGGAQIQENDRVSFSVETGRDGRASAVNVRKA